MDQQQPLGGAGGNTGGRPPPQQQQQQQLAPPAGINPALFFNPMASPPLPQPSAVPQQMAAPNHSGRPQHQQPQQQMVAMPFTFAPPQPQAPSQPPQQPPQGFAMAAPQVFAPASAVDSDNNNTNPMNVSHDQNQALQLQQHFLTEPMLQLPGIPANLTAQVNGMPPGAGFDLAAQAAMLASAQAQVQQQVAQQQQAQAQTQAHHQVAQQAQQAQAQQQKRAGNNSNTNRGNANGGMNAAPQLILPAIPGLMNANAAMGGMQVPQQQAPLQPVPAPAKKPPAKKKRGRPPSAANARKKAASPAASKGGSKRLVPLAPAVDPTASISLSGASTASSIPVPPAASVGGSLQAQLAAAQAAADAAAASIKTDDGGDGTGKAGQAKRGRKSNASTEHLTAEEKAKLHRDRNREHARSTRLRKKAYVNKLKELVEGLRAERSEETKRRRVAVQHLAEVQRVRRAVVGTFLKFHVGYESDPRKWATLLEESGFTFKQPVTPYRYFRRSEIEKECRKIKSVDGVIADAASMAVMIESMGSRSPRWMQIKREDFLARGESRNGGVPARRMPHSIVRQNSRLQHAVSSLSSSSGSTSGHGSGAEEDIQGQTQPGTKLPGDEGKDKKNEGGKKVSSSSSGGDGGSGSGGSLSKPSGSSQSSNDYHDYHAPALPDPMLGDSGSSGNSSPTGSDDAIMADRSQRNGAKRVCTDSSSNEDEGQNGKPGSAKKQRRMISSTQADREGTGSGGDSSSLTAQSFPSMTGSKDNGASGGATAITAPTSQGKLPSNIAKKGGISHNVTVKLDESAHARLSTAPAIPLPPFVGLGKRPSMPKVGATTVGAVIVNKTPGAMHTSSAGSSGSEGANANGVATASAAAQSSLTSESGAGPTAISKSAPENGSISGGSATGERSYAASAATTQAAVIGDNASSASSTSQSTQITSFYHINEDDMLLTDDVLMCPYIFRSQDAVTNGALTECVQPGMLRAQFSSTNKLVNIELVYDAMGFMQQLERASGSEGSAQIVPNSLEMALSPNIDEARVITMAKPPFKIVSVNEAWTRLTKYTQMEVEGKEMTIVNGKRTIPNAPSKNRGRPPHDFNEVAKGRCACSVNIHYDKHGSDFVDFVSSYPLTNSDDNITHLLHVCKKLPVPIQPQDFGSVSFAQTATN